MSKFKDLKVGDIVFVARQCRPYEKERHVTTEEAAVTKVGRKYGYFVMQRREVPFCLNTGHSHHADCNARMNGWGFDVYHSEEEYLACKVAKERHALLCKKLGIEYGKRHLLTPEVVEKIHAVLDEAGI